MKSIYTFRAYDLEENAEIIVEANKRSAAIISICGNDACCNMVYAQIMQAMGITETCSVLS